MRDAVGGSDEGEKAIGGDVDRSETFDEFLAKDGLLAKTEDAALKEMIADQIKVAMDAEA